MSSRATTRAMAVAVTTVICAIGFSGCSNGNPTEPQDHLSHAVDPNSSVFPSYLSTTGIPYMRARIEGEATRAGSLFDMNEPGWAVGSRRAGAGLPVIAIIVHMRTGDTNRIGNAFLPEASQAKAINARGEVVGGAPLPQLQGPTAFHWRDGVLTPLGSGAGMDINDHGVAVGYSWVGSTTAPWVWRGGELQSLGDSVGRANGINNRGDIVGVAPDSATGIWVPVIWRDGSSTPLFSWPRSGEATAINDAGRVVGYALHWGLQEAFAWDNGVVTWLGTLQPGQPSEATAINNRGEIVGNARLTGPTSSVLRAVLWRNGELVDLGLSGTAGEDVSEAFGITNSGQVVGRVGVGGARNGVLWLPPPR